MPNRRLFSLLLMAVCCCFFLSTVAVAYAEDFRPEKYAVKLEKEGLPNLYKVNQFLYRGGQPTKEGFAELKKMGVKTIVNLRSFHSNRQKIGDTGLSSEHIYVKPWHGEDKEVVRFLQIMSDRSKTPVFVHCWRGSDRTGAMVAAYRIVIQGWTKDEAIKEMTQGGYGFNEIWDNFLDNLRKMDIDKIKARVRLGSRACNFSEPEKSLLSAIIYMTDVKAKAVLQNLKTLSMTNEAKTGNYKIFQPLMTAFQADNPDLLIWYVRPDGSYFTVSLGLTGKNLSNRAYFPGLIKGNTVMGEMVVGKTSKRKSLIVGAPCIDKNKVTAAIGASIFVDQLNQSLDEALDLTENLFYFALDQKGVLAMTSRPDLVLESSSAKKNLFDEIVKQGTGQLPCTISGRPGCIIFDTSPTTGWRFALGVVK